MAARCRGLEAASRHLPCFAPHSRFNADRAGVDILTISRRLGHSKAAITLDVYGHLIGGADEAAATAIEGMLK